MAKIANCPCCAKQLCLPDSLQATDRVECPACTSPFALSEVVERSVPLAKVLPAEPPAVEDPLSSVPSDTNPATRNPLEPSSETPQEMETATVDKANSENKSPSTASWEERLKKALGGDLSGTAFDTEPEAKASHTDSTHGDQTEPAAENQPAESHAADPVAATDGLDLTRQFGIDLSSQLAAPKKETASAELAAESSDASQPLQFSSPTLDDFAQEVGAVASEIEADNQASFKASRRSSTKAEQPAAVSLAPNLNKEKRLAPHFDALLGKSPPSPDADAPVPLLTPARRTAHDRHLRLAAFVVAPLIGLMTGLYGLLWLWGPQADYLSLSRILPASLLPQGIHVSTEQNSAEASQFAEASQLTVTEPLPAGDHSEPAAEHYEVASTPAELPNQPIVKQDSAVQPASALQPVSTVSFGRSQGAANEFRALVEQAAYVLPGFVACDLSNTASVSSMGKAYMTLCRLAEQLPLALAADASPALQEQAHPAVQLFRDALADEGNSDDCAHIANAWWGHTGRTNQGIFFRGTVARFLDTTDGVLVWVKVGEKPDTPPIPAMLSHHGYQPGDRVGIVGRISMSTSELRNNVAVKELVEVCYDFEVGAE